MGIHSIISIRQKQLEFRHIQTLATVLVHFQKNLQILEVRHIRVARLVSKAKQNILQENMCFGLVSNQIFC